MVFRSELGDATLFYHRHLSDLDRRRVSRFRAIWYIEATSPGLNGFL